MSPKNTTAAILVAVVVAMAGLAAASAPLYRMVCSVTGLGGTPQRANAAPGATAGNMPGNMTVRFDTMVSGDLPWKFVPRQRQMQVRLGEQALAVFTATNTSKDDITGTATFNVTPDKVGRYVDKIQCFCFSEQHLAAGQSVDMPVVFFIDPALAGDSHTAEVGTITLSYTFFRRNRS
jgi:cytochrome c oxidase assembly protein subunit 11